MDYKEYAPPKRLSHIVECYWSNTLHPGDFNQDHDYIIPDGSTDAIFMVNGSYLRKDEHTDNQHLVEYCSLVPGFQKAVKVIQKPYTNCMVIRFKPGAVEKLSGISVKELNQKAYPLQELIPELADLAMDEIAKQKPVPDIIAKINDWLLLQNSEPQENHIINAFLEQVIHKKGQIEIREFCNRFGMHKSTLEKNFKRQTGLTPKQYANLIRFNNLLNAMMFSGNNLTETGYQMGYFDQSHMIKDFRSIIGITPGEFLEKQFTVPKLAALSIANKGTRF